MCKELIAHPNMTDAEKRAFRRRIAVECRYEVDGFCADSGGWDASSGFRTITEAKREVRELLYRAEDGFPPCSKAMIYDTKTKRVVWLFNTDGGGDVSPEVLARSTPRVAWGVGTIAEEAERERLAFMRELYALETAPLAAV